MQSSSLRKKGVIFSSFHGGVIPSLVQQISPYDGHHDFLNVKEEEIIDFIQELNRAFPSAGIRREEVIAFYCGLRPLVEEERKIDTHHKTRRHEIYNHQEEGIYGLFTVIGGKYTTVRNLSQKLVDQIFISMGEEPPQCRTEGTSL